MVAEFRNQTQARRISSGSDQGDRADPEASVGLQCANNASSLLASSPENDDEGVC